MISVRALEKEVEEFDRQLSDSRISDRELLQSACRLLSKLAWYTIYAVGAETYDR